MGVKFPYAGKEDEQRGRLPIGNAAKSARIDLRVVPETKNALLGICVRTRRTMASMLDEAIEDIIAKHSK